MLLQIIKGTPLWVWALLAALLWLGFRQTRTRVVGSRRAALLPGIFVILSLAGVVTAFRATPWPSRPGRPGSASRSASASA